MKNDLDLILSEAYIQYSMKKYRTVYRTEWTVSKMYKLESHNLMTQYIQQMPDVAEYLTSGSLLGEKNDKDEF